MPCCSNCGTELAPKAAYCSQCGSSVKTDASYPAEARPKAPAQTDVRALISFGLGLLAMMPLSVFAGIPAIVFGHVARSAIRRRQDSRRGAGLALAGLVLGYVSLAALPVVVVIYRAIPRVYRARIAGNQTSALNTLRTINTAAATYQVENKLYPESLETLGQASLTPLDAGLTSSGIQDGYRFTYKPSTSRNSYILRADPVSLVNGELHFYSDATGVVRSEKDRPADARSRAWAPGQ
jgi:hypothetical protein